MRHTCVWMFMKFCLKSRRCLLSLLIYKNINSSPSSTNSSPSRTNSSSNNNTSRSPSNISTSSSNNNTNIRSTNSRSTNSSSNNIRFRRSTKRSSKNNTNSSSNNNTTRISTNSSCPDNTLTLARSTFELATKEDDSLNDSSEARCTHLIQQLNEAGTTASDTYLDEMLRLCKCTTLPKSKSTKVKKILVYLEASKQDRSCVLTTVKQLQAAYFTVQK